MGRRSALQRRCSGQEEARVSTQPSERHRICVYVTIAPITTTIRGVPSEAALNEDDGMKAPCAVNLHNAVTVSQERLGKRVAQLSSTQMKKVCMALRFAVGCDLT